MIMPVTIQYGVGCAEAVLRHAAVLQARDLGREDRDHVGFEIEGHERLVEQVRGVPVLHAERERGIERGRRVPPQDLQRAAAPALRGREGLRLRLRVRDAG
jgi:hypothetical protein